ncbi:multidrug resistance-associated protein [Aspergillus aculeatinus CBS 121060]|uniref:Multidrug resistance-associated protein n=1 Tax=Aspergillus aculeatinus CBS 121060 TaxID=1448322 RepID=A0ACD1HK20_9EURO|nr:multidrug resistance-associated protein [Aspergillus aculeatinus CBS 121060]RAH74153.1 multidrug resistance-associated protein [Aspergillus aculeatinus CBS 121060]
MSSTATSTTDLCGDSLFGPVIRPGCRGGFDFTALFEAAILTIGPAACFLLLSPFRIFQLYKQSPKVISSSLRLPILSLAAILAAIQIPLLALVATEHAPQKHTSLAGAILELLAALVLVAVVDLEHVRSIRPSFLVTAYLFTTLLFDIARVRTSWLSSGSRSYSACLSASLAIKLVLLVLENIDKRKWLIPSEKAKSGESVSGPFSRGLFTWLNRLLRNGYSIILTGDALPTIHERLQSRDLSSRFAESWASCNQSRKNALFLAVIRCLRWEIVGIAFPRLCVVGFSIAQPFLVGKIVTVLERTDSLARDMAYGLIGATAIVFVGVAVFTASYQHLGYRATTMLRGGLMALTYEHMMNLPLGTTDESSAMSLMGTDIEMLAEYFLSTVCETWANVLQLGLATWLLQTQVGAVCIAPFVVVILFTAASFGMGNAVTARQKTWLQATEKRVNFTSAILGSIRNAKFLGLSEIMGTMIDALREEELTISKRFRRIQTIRVCMVNLPSIVGQLATFAAYGIVAAVNGSGGFHVSQAITSLSLVNLLVNPLQQLLLAIPDTFASIGCLHRIQDFLRQPSRVEKRKLARLLSSPATSSRSRSGIELSALSSPITGSLSKQATMDISLENVRFGWKSSPLDKSGVTLILEQSDRGNLVTIVGPVGSGKSTFLKGLAGETPVLDGKLVISHTDIAFCEQMPWLANASIRDNIVGDSGSSSFDERWYHTILKACALNLDIGRMPAEDRTLVGSKGAKLSGGQRQRIAIARALYSRKRIACFDDVFSGLDNVTSQQVFTNVFGPDGLLRQLGCTVFLATHNTQHLPQSDFIIVLGNDGEVLEQGTYSQLRSHMGGYINKLDLSTGQLGDLGAAYTVQSQSELTTTTADTGNASDSCDGDRQTTDTSVYKFYFSSLGWLRVATFVSLLTVNSAVGGFLYIWVERWSSSNDSASGSRSGYWLGIYAALAAVEAGSLALAIFWTWVIIVPAASKHLHSTVLRACMSAPLSYLSNVETGALVTRFSQDMRLVDMILPRGFISLGFQLFSALAQGAITIASLPYIAAALPFLIALLGLLQRFYLRTSRQLRLLEIELKSPLYTHFLESLSGVTTIRAFSWTPVAVSRMLAMLDTAQKPYYLLLCIQRWLSLVLNLIVAALTVIMVGIAVGVRDHVNPGLLGIALVLMVELGQVLSEVIQNWTLLETSLGAIARIKSFSEDTPTEEDPTLEAHEPPVGWPSCGQIEFADTSIAYDTSGSAAAVLSDIRLQFRGGEKIGLCGRTGSGKSSLALSLLRLNEVVSGQILIDGQDISLISRSSIRHRISSLSQEPFLFPGTIRQNADPLNAATDADIVDALRSVGVWDALAAHHKSHSHDEEVLGVKLDDSILSEGQKQLFCLARALLKKSKILILDEPTSSLDKETDARVQKLIRELFQDCTVIMVAHRIHTLLDFDQVVVLDSGRVVEVGHPRGLARRPDGAFAKLLAFEV